MPFVPRLLARSVAALACAAGLAACDQAPGPPPLVSEPPAILDFDVSPLAFNYTGADSVVTIPLVFSVAVDEGDGAVTVRVLVRREFENEALVSAPLVREGDRWVGAGSLEVERGAVGLFVVTAVASGAGGVGNEATALLRYTASDLGPPVVQNATASPNPVPTPGSFTVTAAVEDPDGPINLARVVLESGGAEFQLCDDGGLGVCGFGGSDLPSASGDDTAGDGRYSRQFSVPAEQPPGDFLFTVRAYDLSGQASDPVQLVVTVQ